MRFLRVKTPFFYCLSAWTLINLFHYRTRRCSSWRNLSNWKFFVAKICDCDCSRFCKPLPIVITTVLKSITNVCFIWTKMSTIEAISTIGAAERLQIRWGSIECCWLLYWTLTYYIEVYQSSDNKSLQIIQFFWYF